MKQLFLTSSVHAVAADIAKKLDLKKNNALVFITTPTEPEAEQSDLSWLSADRAALVKAGFQVTDYTISNKTKEELSSELSTFDFIYMSGGDTQYLLQKSLESGFIDVIKDLILVQNKTYIGTSAGSIIAGQKCPDYLLDLQAVQSLASTDGYGLVNFTILPHWGSPYFKEKYLGNRLEIAYKVNQVPLLVLTDTQYVHVKDDWMQIIETA